LKKNYSALPTSFYLHYEKHLGKAQTREYAEERLQIKKKAPKMER